MAKRRLSLRVRLPPYQTPRNVWRRAINRAVREARDRLGIKYNEGDRLEVQIQLYLDERAIITHDVDNRAKDVLDALQGRAGVRRRTIPSRRSFLMTGRSFAFQSISAFHRLKVSAWVI
jgi:hypothetical protein